MSFNQDLNGGNRPLYNSDANIQTAPNSGFDQGFASNNAPTQQQQQYNDLGQYNTDPSSLNHPSYDATQQSGPTRSSAYNQDSGLGSNAGNYNTTQASRDAGYNENPSSAEWNNYQQQAQGYDSQQAGTYRSTQDSTDYPGGSYDPSQYSGGRKPSASEKIKGNLEKLAGKVTGQPDKVMHGDDVAHGRIV